ncbi:MAG: hypothetical protein K9G13_02095 [Aquiluna sp.]|nr:hypothetical protein [Aquiluna sp.]MCF8545316.1 hypothetical protein [Aquiluna sp.]
MNIYSDRGSSPLEIVAWSVLLLLPVTPMLEIYHQLSDQLAAESIARHGLRAAVFGFQSGVEPQEALDAALVPLAKSWNKALSAVNLQCTPTCTAGSLMHLEIRINSATAIQSAGLQEQ